MFPDIFHFYVKVYVLDSLFTFFNFLSVVKRDGKFHYLEGYYYIIFSSICGFFQSFSVCLPKT